MLETLEDRFGLLAGPHAFGHLLRRKGLSRVGRQESENSVLERDHRRRRFFPRLHARLVVRIDMNQTCVEAHCAFEQCDEFADRRWSHFL